MSLFSTKYLTELVHTLRSDAVVSIVQNGSHYTTATMLICLPGAAKQARNDIRMIGFVTDANGLAGLHDDVAVDYIELLSLHANSEGGIVASDEDQLLFGHRLKNSLIAAGHVVVPTMSDYF